jgi:hypothetical protein
LRKLDLSDRREIKDDRANLQHDFDRRRRGDSRGRGRPDRRGGERAWIVPEGVDAATARAILAAIRPQSRGVALSLADDRDEICAMVDSVQPDVVHVAAREIEPEDCAWIRRRIAPVRLLRAIAVRAGETLAEADAHQEVVDYLMLDSGAKARPS